MRGSYVLQSTYIYDEYEVNEGKYGLCQLHFVKSFYVDFRLSDVCYERFKYSSI